MKYMIFGLKNYTHNYNTVIMFYTRILLLTALVILLLVVIANCATNDEKQPEIRLVCFSGRMVAMVAKPGQPTIMSDIYIKDILDNKSEFITPITSGCKEHNGLVSEIIQVDRVIKSTISYKKEEK